MGAIFLGSVGLFLLTILQIRYWFMSAIPLGLRVGIGAGIGLFIALIGFKNMGLVVANPATLVALGDLHDPKY
ncbi:xanthine/uracil family permease [Actinobacillus equuli]|nr:xanthine/uracil family permease [Actinobacillus equuli]